MSTNRQADEFDCINSTHHADLIAIIFDGFIYLLPSGTYVRTSVNRFMFIEGIKKILHLLVNCMTKTSGKFHQDRLNSFRKLLKADFENTGRHSGAFKGLSLPGCERASYQSCIFETVIRPDVENLR